MDVQQLHYAPLLNQLHQRAVRSVVSQLALRSKSLTHYLESQYFQPPGQEGSLLADPVFESTFGWMPADETMEDLRDKLISSPLVDALSKAPVNRPGFPGECFICELRLPDHRFRWKH
ncbi:hypothetical protein RNO38_24065, partial [Escherichia coli]|nr:hypothetical protein [Escherichia coli]